MHWVIKKGYCGEGYLDIIDSVERLGHSYSLVNYKRSENISIEINDKFDTNQVMVYGGLGLINYAQKNNWKIGAFFNDNFSVDVWQKHYKEELLNDDSIITTLGELEVPHLDNFFIRPLHDNKSFNGQLMSRSEYMDWRKKIIEMNTESYSAVDKNTQITIAKPKYIVTEYRLFVVDSQIITGSEYRRGNKIFYNAHVPEFVIAYAQKVMSIWQPDRAYCLDIAEVYQENAPSICKVLEINCINGCGLYAADPDKYVHFLSEVVA